jgi:hypothetical protein
LGSVLFYVFTDSGKPVVERLGGGAAFGLSILQFPAGAEEGGRRGSGFADKNGFESGDAGEGKEICAGDLPSSRRTFGATDSPPPLKSGTGGENGFGGG